ncbi:CPBP family intramembrane glutamic endopeptidase [Cellvibrio fontiphilus]|jgi:hypothetical protein|uniref:CPBP family intramembrane glutamic endopeptidase n=1 Tax=Cellvibrio fontiphilus TaxID=1815559 RepID=A0ABV7FBX1_9GAMM
MERKLRFGEVVVSQLAILLVGALALGFGEIHWQLWVFSPLVDSLLAVLAALFTYGLIYLMYRHAGRFAASLLADMQKITLHFADYSWAKIACVALLAGVGEELLFRLALQGGLTGYLSVPLAIVIPALVFGLLHFLSWAYFIAATLMGLAFGIVYHYTQSAMLVIIWHAVYDLIALGVMIKYPQWLGLPPPVKNAFLS